MTDAREGDGLLVAVRRSKTNPAGETADVRFVKGDVARALRERRRQCEDPVAVQLLLPEMGGITGFYEARTDRVLCVRCAGTPRPARTPIAEPDCGDLHCSRCRQPLRPVNRRDESNAAPGLFA